LTQTNLQELTPRQSEEQELLENRLERRACKKDPLYFLLKYGKILDANEGIIPFKLWEHQIASLNLLTSHKLLIFLKARQIGMTWLMAGYSLWKALFHTGANVILLSKNEEAAGETLGYIKFIHSQLPDFLRVTRYPDQGSLIGFPAVHSKIRALPAVSSAGIGFGQASLIVADEWDLWNDQEDVRRNYAEIKPMIDRAGQFVILSAVNKYEQDTKFKEIWLRAKEGENNFYPQFWDCFVVPGRDLAWYEEQKKEYDQWELEGRYPKTEQEALAAPQLVCRFEVSALNAMQEDCKSPLRIERNGLVKIYKEPATNVRYCLVVDPSEGAYDPAGGMVADWATCEKVAEFHGKIPLDEQAQIAYDFYERYNQPYTAVERNAQGIALVERLKTQGITNWFFCDKQHQKEGWWTSNTTRPVMITDLAEAVRLRQIREPNEQALSQFHSFIRTKKKPEGEARGGAHDEYVMEWAIFLQIRKHINPHRGSFKSYIRKETTY
jgi:hypothetical protein